MFGAIVSTLGRKGVLLVRLIPCVSLINCQQVAMSPAGVGELHGARLLCREKGLGVALMGFVGQLLGWPERSDSEKYLGAAMTGMCLIWVLWWEMCLRAAMTGMCRGWILLWEMWLGVAARPLF